MGCAASIRVADREFSGAITASENSQSLPQNRKSRILNNRDADRDINEYYETKKTSVLGSGASGTVRVCVHRATGTQYALKMLYKCGIPSAENLEKLRQECKIMASLDHPNIIRLHDYFETPSRIYLVLELCRGGDLLERLHAQDSHRYGEFSACRHVQTILAAVRYLHEHGIVHRDLKPSNFLLEDDSLDAELKLIDFGMSAFHPLQQSDDSVTDVSASATTGAVAAAIAAHASGSISGDSISFSSHFGPTSSKRVCNSAPAGTPYYVAPEVLEGYYDAKCDVWSIGVIAYMLLSGEPPFTGRNEHQIFLAIRRGKVKFEEEYFGSVSDSAKDFICQCLTHDPTTRPSAAELLSHPWFEQLSLYETVHPLPTISIPPIYEDDQSSMCLGQDEKEEGEHHGDADQDDRCYNREEREDSCDRGVTAPRPAVLVERRDAAVSGNIVTRLKLFAKRSMLSKLFMEVVAHALSSDEVRHLKHEFVKFDPHRSGEISYADFYKVLRSGSSKSSRSSAQDALISDEDLKRLAEGINLEQSGVIRYHEFIAATLESQNITDNNLRVAFEMMSNHNDYIEAEDLLELLGQDGSMAAVQEMLKESEITEDRGKTRISFQQFVSIMRGESPSSKNKKVSALTSPYVLHRKKLLFNGRGGNGSGRSSVGSGGETSDPRVRLMPPSSSSCKVNSAAGTVTGGSGTHSSHSKAAHSNSLTMETPPSSSAHLARHC